MILSLFFILIFCDLLIFSNFSDFQYSDFRIFRIFLYFSGIAAGVESMTSNSMNSKAPPSVMNEEDVKMNMESLNCLIPMGITSENVAAKYNVSRQEQDAFAVVSHQRAHEATFGADRKFSHEIIPIVTKYKDPKSGKVSTITVDKDDGIRGNSTVEGLGKLRAVFKKGGSTTAGNASQTSDGAAAVLLMKRSKAKELGLKVMARFRAFAVSGVGLFCISI